MARTSRAQVSFNGGAVSRRLRARRDQTLYAIACDKMVGFAPLVEGPAEAMPGTIYVGQELGECRLKRFEYSTTQGHVLAFSAGKIRVYTNDQLLTTINSPFSLEQVKSLRTHQSFDVLYCCHPDEQTQQFYRSGATTFGIEELELDNGPFEPRNGDKTITVQASSSTGTATLTASKPIFKSTDVGAIFQLEAGDFADVKAWEPYITVAVNELLTANEKVYKVIQVGTAGRTGTATPYHQEGSMWDGKATGTDINGNTTGGALLQFMYDRIGIVKITGYSSTTQVTTTVLRSLPGSVVAAGTWRWRHGAFSKTRGWPQTAAIWNERLCLAKDQTIYASVAADLNNFAELNEFGEPSIDMAFTVTLDDPNLIEHLVPTDRLLVVTAGGVHAVGPNNAASGVGPGNVRSERQHDAGGGDAPPVQVNSRTLHIDRTGRRIYETDIDPSRGVEGEVDLTRYARWAGTPGLVELASQQHPFNHLWAARGDGSLACATYLPEEVVLGFAARTMAPGVQARSICAITDPAGEFDQIWIAAEYNGGWHMLRMAPWRHDGESDNTACVLDLAGEYEGAAKTSFTAAHLKNKDIAVVADGQLIRTRTNASGVFTLETPAARAVYGLEFEAFIESLPFEEGGDNASIAHKAKFGRCFIEVERSRGLAFGTPEGTNGSPAYLKLLEEVSSETVPGDPMAEVTGVRVINCAGDFTREPRLRVERVAPFQATIASWGGDLQVNGL